MLILSQPIDGIIFANSTQWQVLGDSEQWIEGAGVAGIRVPAYSPRLRLAH